MKDWTPNLKYIRLTCPKCGRSVVVLTGSTAWCVCVGNPEMEESAT